MRLARPNCFKLLTQVMFWAWALALASAGKSSAAKIAMMAITTSSSISVNPAPVWLLGVHVIVSSLPRKNSDQEAPAAVVLFQPEHFPGSVDLNPEELHRIRRTNHIRRDGTGLRPPWAGKVGGAQESAVIGPIQGQAAPADGRGETDRIKANGLELGSIEVRFRIGSNPVRLEANGCLVD